jgi:hypothetical protein
MIIAALMCAWLAGVVFGWRLGLVQRRTDAELAYWVVANSDRPPFDWAKEPGQ